MTVQDVVPYAQIAAAFAVTLSALTATLIYWSNKSTARRRATLDMVLKTFIDDEGRDRYDKYRKLIREFQDENNPADMLIYAEADAPIDAAKATLRDQLNEYELVSLGIRKGVFDEAVYKLWFQGQFERDFVDLCPYITRVREQRPSVFCEYVRLYEKWQKRPHPENAPPRYKIVWWGLTLNKAKLKAYAAIEPTCN